MRRSSFSLRLSGSSATVGAEMEDAIFARQSLIEELLSRQYNTSTFAAKNEEPNENESTLLGSVTLLMSKWDNKRGCSSLPSKTKSIPSAGNDLVNATESGRSNINSYRYTLAGNIDPDSNSNQNYSVYTGESDTMAVMIDEDNLSLEDYEDEEQELEGGEYDYADDDDDDDDDDVMEDMELSEALRIVRGRKSWSVNDYRARYKAHKRKADSDDTNSVSAKMDNCSIDDHEEGTFDGKPIRMVKIVIENEEYESLLEKNITARLREKYVRLIQSQSGPITNFSRDNQNPVSIASAHYTSNYIEAYGPVDREVGFYF